LRFYSVCFLFFIADGIRQKSRNKVTTHVRHQALQLPFEYRLLTLMCRFFLILFFALFLTCAKGQTALPDSIINSSEAKKIMQFLASDSLKGRLTGTDEAQKAAVFIAEQFLSARLRRITGYNGYFMPFTFLTKEGNQKTGYNVLSALPGKTKANEVIIFSAHYDHVGTFSTNPWPSEYEHGSANDSIYNGANDDASGVTALILLARFFSGEELNLAGSHALSLEIEPANTVAQINIEMIGRTKAKKLHPFITGANLSNLKSLLNNTLYSLDTNKYGKSFFVDDPYQSQNLFYRSDNLWLAKKGIPGHTIMLASADDIFYHTVDDEIETIDFEILIQVIRALALGCKDIIQGNATPTRINVNKLRN
jgi:hypothetical protein